MKSKMTGQPNWWHGTTGSPVTYEVTQKVTEKTDFQLKETVSPKPNKNPDLVKEYESNCKTAQILKKKQENDEKM